MTWNLARANTKAYQLGLAIALCCALGAGLWAAPPAMAQQAPPQGPTKLVEEHKDWNVFEHTEPLECWVASMPKQSRNTRNGRVVRVRRGDIVLMVSYIPGKAIRGEVNFTGGYPFAKDSRAILTIGNQNFDLFAQGEWAWADTPETDAKMIAAMKKGARASIVAHSTRGTRTSDTFSLLGFTAALEQAEQRCYGGGAS